MGAVKSFLHEQAEVGAQKVIKHLPDAAVDLELHFKIEDTFFEVLAETLFRIGLYKQQEKKEEHGTGADTADFPGDL